MKRHPGIYRVTQAFGNNPVARDFDAEEWSYEWAGKNSLLRLLHDGDTDATDSCDFVEFSAPVSIEFIRED